jgi:hypothetical protein
LDGIPEPVPEEDDFHTILEEGKSFEDCEEIPSGCETLDAGFDEQEREAFLTSLPEEDKRGPFTRRWMWQITKQRQDADILSPLIYWTTKFGHRPNVARGLPKRWTAMSTEALVEATGWPNVSDG